MEWPSMRSSFEVTSTSVDGVILFLRTTYAIIFLYALVAQLAEATDSKPVQCEFESHQGHHNKTLAGELFCEGFVVSRTRRRHRLQPRQREHRWPGWALLRAKSVASGFSLGCHHRPRPRRRTRTCWAHQWSQPGGQNLPSPSTVGFQRLCPRRAPRAGLWPPARLPQGGFSAAVRYEFPRFPAAAAPRFQLSR